VVADYVFALARRAVHAAADLFFNQFGKKPLDPD
jgi:hypothetical protein